jgi:glycosyltransferase involved in cell wall biosynthesis
MTLQKGPDYFLRAAKIALTYRPNTLFVMVGSGDMEHQIMREAGHLGIATTVLFAGFFRGKELSQMYRSADVFVMPSVSEPFGITALESLAHGTPILVSKQSGVSEFITNCLKVDFWDIDEMANKMVAVLEYQSLHSALKDNGEREVQKYSWRDAALRCVRIYERLTQTQTAPVFATA